MFFIQFLESRRQILLNIFQFSTLKSIFYSNIQRELRNEVKDDIFSRPLVILGQNCVDLMSVNLPSPLLVPNCPRINICSVCFLSGKAKGKEISNLVFI